MKCPKCEGKLHPIETSEGITIDFCRDCHGILFDRGEVAEQFELGDDLPGLTAGPRRKTSHVCPRCGGNWVELPFAGQASLLVDTCPGCGALWLDEGEFARLEAVARTIDSPRTRMMRAVKTLRDRGFQVIGVKKV